MTAVLSDEKCLLTAGGPVPSDQELHQQTVPRRYVHRSAVSDVLLTGWHQAAPDLFVLGAQWPRTHSFYRPVAGVYDPLMIAETVRQAGLLIAHAGYGVPLDHPFLLRDMSYQAEPDLLQVDSSPADLTVAVSCDEVRLRRGVLAGVRCQADLYRGTSRVGGGMVRGDILSPRTYARVRAPFLSAERSAVVPVQGSCRGEVANTVLVPTGMPFHWQIQADRRHPVLFDHPVDHVPGMVLVEAMRQAANLISGRGPTAPFGLQSTFIRYAELHRPVFVRAFPEPLEASGERTVRLAVEQDGEAVAHGALRVRELPREVRLP